jgi:hypothetical protein
MSTLEELLRLIRQLPPDLQDVFRRLLDGTLPVGPPLLVDLLRRLIATAADRGVIIRILWLLARLGRLSPAVLEAALAEAQAGAVAGGAATGAAEGAGAAGGAGAAAGGGTAAGGAAVAATIASILIAVLAILYATWSIYSEATTELELPPDGPPCGLATPEGRAMATVDRAITVSAIGSRTSLNKAIRLAQESCEADAANCTGQCAGGKRCWPAASVQSWEQWYRVFWTTTRIVFRCPCGCVERPTPP